MKAKIVYIILLLGALSTLTGCTHNDGDIGNLFGLWKVTSISIDDKQMEDYEGNLFYAFQNNVFCQRYIKEPAHEEYQTFAQWKYSQKGIEIDFIDPKYSPIAISGMNQGINSVKILSQTNENMEISYIGTSDRQYRLTLKKW